jgi:phage shock protein A
MGVFNRIGRMVRANINDVLDKAENPAKLVKQLILDMEKELGEAKEQVAIAIANEKKLKAKYEENERLATDWAGKAMLAVEKGEDDLAREAIRRKTSHANLARSFKEQWTKQAEAVEALKQGLEQLDLKLEEAKRQKSLLLARQKRAEVTKQITKTVGKMPQTGAFQAFDRMLERIEDMEAEAEAFTELNTDSLERRFKKLEGEPDIEAELLQLKEQAAAGSADQGVRPGRSSRRALPAGE